MHNAAASAAAADRVLLFLFLIIGILIIYEFCSYYCLNVDVDLSYIFNLYV